MRQLLERLKENEILVADGAMGSMLLDEGLKAGDCPESINLKRPEIIRKIAGLYLEAGADIVQTNTFGASPLKLSQYSLEHRTEEINAAAVRAVRSAIKDKAYLSASCGPCGRLLKPYGDAEPEEVLEGFERQMKALVAEGIDLICIETMTDLSEATLAVRAAKSISSATPVCATMTFDETPRGFFTIMGVGIEEAARGLAKAGADIVGSNCGNGIEKMIKIAACFKDHTNLPVIIQSNAGIPKVRVNKAIYPETPDFMAEQCKKLLAYGINIIGGCCGTRPEHIAAIRKIVDEYAKK